MTQEPSRFVWYELITTDMEAAAKFYGAVVGWSVEASATPGMDYRQWSMGGSSVGGLMAVPAAAAGMPPAWLGYLKVADVDASVAAVTQAGGAVHMPPTDIPDVGRIAMVADPQGAAIYVMAPRAADGRSVSFAPGKPGHVGWNELHAHDWKAALAFYGEHFGWGTSDAVDMGPIGTYQMFNVGAEAIGGMMNSPTPGPAHWSYYFGVDDIDAAGGRVAQAGGQVLHGPVQVPGGSWIIQAQDPQGAYFALVASPKG